MEKNKQEIFHKFIWYMLIFSIIGLILETIYCFITTGVLESRKGLILGPVCPIYGVGAVTIIYGLRRFRGQKIKLVGLGIVCGCVAEYCISYGLEALYGTRFWDYSYLSYDINGRICLIYGLFWGILSLLLIEYVEPLFDKLISKFKIKWIDYMISVIFIIDCILTIWGVNVYTERATVGRSAKPEYNIIQKAKYDFEETCFSNEIMLNIFPNIRVMDENGNERFIKEILLH